MFAPTAELVESPVVMLPRVEMDRDSPTEVIVLTDVHLGASDHMTSLWQRDRDYILGRDPKNTAVLVLGDMLQLDSKYQKHSGVYQQRLSPQEQVQMAGENLAQLRPYIRLLLAGNHDNRALDAVGLDPTEFIAHKAGIESVYVRDNAIVTLSVGRGPSDRDDNPRPITYMVYAWHGEGTGQSDASLLRAANRVPNADLYTAGHIHTRKVLYSSTHIPDTRTMRVNFKRRVIASCPSYQQGAGWTNRKNYAESDWGMSRFTLNARHRFVKAEDTIG